MSLSVPNSRFNYSLKIITLFYVLIPSILFIHNWVIQPFSIVCNLCIISTLLFILYKEFTNQAKESYNIFNFKTLISATVVSFTLCFISGAGEFVPQFYDYLLHNAKFNLLTTENWPIYNANRDVYMCYYLGYYIVPSGLGKWFDLSLVKYISFIWLWIGLLLSMLWIHLLFKELSLAKRVLASIMIWSGCYVAIIFPALEVLLHRPSFIGSNSVFFGTNEMMLHYSSILKSVVEGPQHAITAILGGAMFLALGCSPSQIKLFSLFTIATLFWSPFVTIGLAPFVIYCYYLYLVEKGLIEFIKKELPTLLLAFIGFLPLVLYTLGSSATDMKSNRFFLHTSDPHPLLSYLLFVGVSIGIWFVFFGKRLFYLNSPMVWISIVSLLVLSFFQIGYFNDLNNRASVPGLLIIGLSITSILLDNESYKTKNKFLIMGLLFWVLNTGSTLKYVINTLKSISLEPINTISDPYLSYGDNDYYNFMEKLYTQNSAEVIKQYSLNRESIFQKYLLK